MSVSVVSSPFEIKDTFLCIMDFLKPADIVQSALVCKSWNRFIKDSSLFWKKRFEYEGIPLVDGPARNYKEDFLILYPRTISGRMIAKLFGEVVGPIPPISEEVFNRLKESDPYKENRTLTSSIGRVIYQFFGQNKKGKLKEETFVFVVVPHLIRRTIDKDTPLDLDEFGNLIVQPNSTETATVLEIPFTAKNLVTLCSYPLRRKENMPVFSKDSSHGDLMQCPPTLRNIVWCMRKNVAEETSEQPYAKQKKLVEERGDKVTPFLVRAISVAVGKLTTGTCPDIHDRPYHGISFVRTSDPCLYGTYASQLLIERYGGSSVYIPNTFCPDSSCAGVVPGFPADVPQ